MKIFSNFDTRLYHDLYEIEVAHYGPDKVLVVHRSSIYVWLRIVLPVVWFCLILALMIYTQMKISSIQNISSIITLLGKTIIIVSSCLVIGYICRKLSDYYMDFAIITPRQIVSYEQRGLFRRSSISLDLTNLRSINEEKNGILKSIFNYGTVVFLSEWWDYRQEDDPDAAIDASMIKLNYITYPRKLREKILRIVRD